MKFVFLFEAIDYYFEPTINFRKSIIEIRN